MDSFIYHGGEGVNRDERIHADFDFTKHVVTMLESEKSLKIEDIRVLHAGLTLSSSTRRLVYIPRAQMLTPAAQNALLKTLEEPPSNTTFVLASENLDALLPTIRSRCVLIKVVRSMQTLDPTPLALIKEALAASAGARITLADGIGKDRGEVLTYIDTLIKALHHKMRQTSAEKQLMFLSNVATAAVNTREALRNNVGVGLALREFLLRLPRTVAPVRMKG